MNTVAVIDYGMGNLHSVAKALEHAPQRANVIITSDLQTIVNADRVVLPGVGAMRDCMAEMRRLGVDTVVNEVLAQGKPLLAVCVGMQALMRFSAENNGVNCLNILPGEVKFFGEQLRDPQTQQRLKVPHMGWNEVTQTRAHPLWQGIAQDSRFYFVHSYYVQADVENQVVGRTHYGIPFAAALARDNLFAVQFHPEKSAQAGLQLYENFLNWDGKV
jgi:glutamine amidotransferase